MEYYHKKAESFDKRRAEFKKEKTNNDAHSKQTQNK
jgi:hypothetical protein